MLGYGMQSALPAPLASIPGRTIIRKVGLVSTDCACANQGCIEGGRGGYFAPHWPSFAPLGFGKFWFWLNDSKDGGTEKLVGSHFSYRAMTFPAPHIHNFVKIIACSIKSACSCACWYLAYSFYELKLCQKWSKPQISKFFQGSMPPDPPSLACTFGACIRGAQWPKILDAALLTIHRYLAAMDILVSKTMTSQRMEVDWRK